jgi:hypothetical protein
MPLARLAEKEVGEIQGADSQVGACKTVSNLSQRLILNSAARHIRIIARKPIRKLAAESPDCCVYVRNGFRRGFRPTSCEISFRYMRAFALELKLCTLTQMVFRWARDLGIRQTPNIFITYSEAPKSVSKRIRSPVLSLFVDALGVRSQNPRFGDLVRSI